MPAVWLAIVCSLFGQQLPPRDTPGPATMAKERGTAVVRGRVVDRETGAPIARAVVILVRMSGRDAPHRRYVRSAEDGRFEFTALVAGSYHLGALTGDERPTHLPQLVGTSAPSPRRAPTVPATTLDIADGDMRDDIHLALSRALVIAGVVLNEFGEPLAGMQVRAELLRGNRVVRRSPIRSTDDRGEFRIFGLPPGRYRVCALAPPPYLDPPVFPERLITTCHPSAGREQDAALVALGTGAEPHVQIRMQRSQLFTLRGVVVGATGEPAANASVRVSSRNRLDVYGMTYRAAPDGRFTVTDLVPGEYDVQASTPNPNRAGDGTGEFAAQPVTVTSADVDVVLAMSRTATVAGHVLFEQGSLPPEALPRLSVVAIGTVRAPRAGAARVQPDLTFVLDGLFGPQVLDVGGLPDGWVLKSVRYAGADVTETPTEFRTSADSRHLEVTLTPQGAAVIGQVLDATGAPVPAARVFLIPAEAQRWNQGNPQATRVSGERGAFAFEHQRPGEHVIVALSQEDAPEDLERDDYELLATLGDRISLGDGERRALTLRLVVPPGGDRQAPAEAPVADPPPLPGRSR